jgi:hypothetical protein
MLEMSDAPRRDITVQGLILQYPQPYEVGHQLIEGEVVAINQTFGENLRNNFAGKVKKACEEAGVENSSELPAETKAQLQKDFDTFAEGYEFGARGGRETDPVKSKALELATNKVKASLKAKGHKLSEVGTDKIRDWAEAAIEKNPDFLKAAQRIVDASRAAAAELEVDL